MKGVLENILSVFLCDIYLGLQLDARLIFGDQLESCIEGTQPSP